MTCSATTIELNSGYQMLLGGAENASSAWHAFKCPVPDACPAQVLLSQPSEAKHPRLNCTEGHTGVLCASCVDGWKQGPVGTCQRCGISSSGGLNPFLLIPVAVALTYIAARVILTFRRTQRLQKVEAAAALFDDIDCDHSSGIITVAELRAGLISLGLHLTEDAVRKIVDSVAANDSDHITKDEFVACK